jgi:hypothetical protein
MAMIKAIIATTKLAAAIQKAIPDYFKMLASSLPSFSVSPVLTLSIGMFTSSYSGEF